MMPAVRTMKRESALDPYFLDRRASVPSGLAELVQFDQEQCWKSGRVRFVEEYVERFPHLVEDGEELLDIVYHEFLLRKELEPDIGAHEYTTRFPDLAGQFLQQLALHDAIDVYPMDTVPLGDLESPLSDESVESEHTTFAGRYQLRELLGAGGMGEVYSAWDSELERLVAVKLPKLTSNSDEQVQERILREARALAKLDHPGICPIFDFGRIGESCFIVMRLLSGKSLLAHLEQVHRLNVDDAVQVVFKIAEAVAAAHEMGIAHRDLKPSNVVLEQLNTPVVIDFGLVRSTSVNEVELTASGIITGTPAYIAPERLGESKNLNLMLADIYSLGVILYELVAGKRPHDSPSTPSLLVQILTKAIEPPSKAAPEVPPALDAICLKALARNPTERYASMSEFARALAEFRSVEIAKDNGLHGATSRNVKRKAHDLWVGAGLVSTVILVGVAVLTAVLFNLQPAGEVVRVGERWSGEYQFDQDGETGPAELSIEQLSGSVVEGKYSTEGGEFVWKFEGQLTGSLMDVRLTEALTPSAESVGVAGVALIKGKVVDDNFVATYEDSEGAASLRLRRQTH
jgi:hypothetical protein